MNEVSTFKISEDNGYQSISARELYEKLEITDRFSRWFESLLKYGFIENEDFTSVKTSTLVNNGAERELQDYAISIEMAKQICMLQRSEKGKQYRDYFIKLEKAWNSPEAVMARALQFANKTLAEVRKRAEIAKQAVDRIENSEGCFTMSQTAKALKLPYGRNKLYEKLVGMKLITAFHEPYQEYINSGYFKVVTKVCDDGKNHLVPLVTNKGLIFLSKRFNTEIDKSVVANR